MLRLALCFAVLTSAAHADGYVVGDTVEDPLQIAQGHLADFYYEEEGGPRIEVDVRMGFLGRITILVAETGYADDSIAGQRWHYVLEQGEVDWTLIYFDVQQMCGRGLNTVTWQDGPCI